VAVDEEGAAERLRTALELSELAERMLRQRLRREHPGASAARIEELVARWYETRPGAEHGDAEGRPVPWPRQRIEAPDRRPRDPCRLQRDRRRANRADE
jgi:hypothetical protein